jgi:hypothetical protein
MGYRPYAPTVVSAAPTDAHFLPVQLLHPTSLGALSSMRSVTTQMLLPPPLLRPT